MTLLAVAALTSEFLRELWMQDKAAEKRFNDMVAI